MQNHKILQSQDQFTPQNAWGRETLQRRWDKVVVASSDLV
jgi:hypothetical protein